MLDLLFAELLASSRNIDKPLRGGALLRWLPAQHTLIACRRNERLQKGEAKTFEAYIRRAGYSFHTRADYTGVIDGVIHHGAALL